MRGGLAGNPGAQPAAAAANPSAEIAELVRRQFGAAFSVRTSFPTPFLTADLDEDGVEDAVIVAFAKDPLVDQQAYHYKVLDPYDDFFGFGDPRITVGFNQFDPQRNNMLLLIHGAGAEAWRAAVPKSKFVLINVPFDRLEIGRALIKKKVYPTIAAQESQLLTSIVFWDPKKKKYRWEPHAVAGE